MSPPFNIYKVGSGGIHWMEATADLGRAKAYVKALVASSHGEYIIANQQMGGKISIKSPAKRIMFQIGYDEKGLHARAELFRSFGQEVSSVADNEAAKQNMP